MAKFLATYLVVTGIGAFVALAMPSLVVLGFFLLILPGLILSLAPTAFLWGCIFAASWWLCRSMMGEMIAILPALAVTAAVLFAVPAPSRQAGQLLFRASLLPDVEPAASIEPAGDIRLDLPNPRWDKASRGPDGKVQALACDNLCFALLLSPGVTSVTVNSSAGFTIDQHREGKGGLVAAARTFRLRPIGECGERAVVPELEGRSGLFGKTLEENRRIAAEWNLKLAAELCVTAEPPLRRFDMQLRQGRYRVPEGKARPTRRWSLGHGPADVDYVEIADGAGRVLLRKLVSKVAVPSRILHIAASGGMENFRFHWGRTTLSNARRYAEVDLVKTLAERTTLGGQAPAADLVPQIRAHLKAALADPARPAGDPVFATLEAWFGGIKSAPLSEEDLALVTALILDERLTDYRGLWELQKLPPDQHRQIGAAIVLRLLAAKDPLALRRTPFSQFLASSPPGAFATLSDDEQALLASPERRIAAPALAARLADGGAGSVPALLDILRHHADAWNRVRESRESSSKRSSIVEAHSGMVSGARIGLCRLGPDAGAALPAIEAMIADGTIAPFMLRGHGGTDWNLLLLRLGKPPGEIRKPESISGTEDNYRRNMENRLVRFDPERSCGRL